MKIKIFKGYMSLGGDNQGLESKVNAFINGKNVIDIKQSLSSNESTTGLYFAMITVMYE